MMTTRNLRPKFEKAKNGPFPEKTLPLKWKDLVGFAQGEVTYPDRKNPELSGSVAEAADSEGL